MSLTNRFYQAEDFQQKIARLKEKSDYYPHIVFEITLEPSNGGTKVFASTLVRIQRNDCWYTVHCVESSVLFHHYDTQAFFERIMESVHKIQHCYVLTGIAGLEDVDKLQESEQERVMKLSKPYK